MSLKERIRTWLGVDERMLTPQQVWGSGGIWRNISGAGVMVTPETAMKAAQGACIRLLADDIAGLPMDAFRKVNGRAVQIDPPVWFISPAGNRWYTRPVFISELVVSLLSDGNDFVRCWPDTLSPGVFTVLEPSLVRLPPDDMTAYDVQGTRYSDMQIMHIPWVTLPGQRRGLSVIEAAEDTTGLELAARNWAGAFFKNGGTLGGIIEVPGDPSTVDAEGIREAFEARHTGSQNWWRPAVLTGGATFEQQVIKPQEAELEPLWSHVLEEAARLYHIPPHMLASQEPGGSSYSSIEHRSIEYVQHAVVNVTTRLEAALSLLIPGDDTYVKFNVNALLRGDMKSRAEFYNLMLQSKVIRREEVRDKEELPFDGELGYLETPNNNGAREEAPQQLARSEPVNLSFSDAPINVTAAPVEVHAAPTAIEAHLDSVRISDDAARQMTESSNTAFMAAAAAIMDATVEDREVLTRVLLAAVAQARLEQSEEVAALRAEVAKRQLPSRHRFTRDEQGRVVGVIQQQGDQTIRKVVERDENGTILSLSEYVA